VRRIYLLVAASIFGTSAYAQNSVLGHAENANFGNVNNSSSAEADLAKRQAALQYTQQINDINSGFNNQIGSLQTQLAQQQVQKNQCEIDYAQAIGDAESNAQDQKSGALNGLMQQAMGPTVQALGGLLNKEDEKQKENFDIQVQSFNSQVDSTFREFQLGGSAAFHHPPSGLNANNYNQFRTACSNLQLSETDPRRGDIKKGQCDQAVANLESQKLALNNLATQFNVDQNASSDTAGKLLQAAIPIGLGLYGYNTTKKGAEQGLESTKEAAESARQQCNANADIAVNETKRQLSSLEGQKQEALKAALASANLANDALKAELAQQALEATYGPDPQGIVVDPSTLPNSDGGLNAALAVGPTVGDPELPGNGSNGPLGFAQNSNSDDKAGAAGGGGGGGGGAGGGGGSPWTFGSSYAGFPGGGGLPEQPDKGKFSGTGGGGFGGGGFGGFDSAQDAFNSFAQWGQDSGQGRSLAASGDGGMLVLLQRARLRLSAHAAELLTDNNAPLLSRSEKQEKGDANPKSAQRATASRLR